jgi:hypothetical protein
VLSLQLDGTEQVQLGQDGSRHSGSKCENRHFGFAVFIVGGQQEECLGKAQFRRLGCFSVHSIMVHPSKGYRYGRST